MLEFEKKSEILKAERNTSMLNFLNNRGGSVSFDVYMQEHLFGKYGFYKQAVEIGTKEGFTTLAQDPVYAKLMALYLQQGGSAGEDFMEIAGGTGVFKRSFLNASPGTHYISVDLSPKLAAMQKTEKEIDEKVYNVDTFIGNPVQALPLKDGYVEGIIFANELLDVLPARAFVAVSNKGSVAVKNEINVVLEGGKVFAPIKPIDQKDKVGTGLADLYQEYLKQSKRFPENTADAYIACVSPHFGKLISELLRVLKKGKIILADYGYYSYQDFAKNRSSKIGPYNNIDIRTVEAAPGIVERPYATDITYFVDFGFYEWLVKKLHPSLKVQCISQEDFFSNEYSQVLPQQLEKYNKYVKNPSHTLYVLEITKS